MSSGNKYHRSFQTLENGKIDVYCVLEAFNVQCPARQHALKKLLCAGIRGKGDAVQDLKECRDAIDRAIEMEDKRPEPAFVLGSGAQITFGTINKIDLPEGCPSLGGSSKESDKER